MNPRIEELAEGCFEYFEPNCDGDTMSFDYKKFAELIVKECALELDDGSKDGLWVKKVLYKHFGIKE